MEEGKLAFLVTFTLNGQSVRTTAPRQEKISVMIEARNIDEAKRKADAIPWAGTNYIEPNPVAIGDKNLSEILQQICRERGFKPLEKLKPASVAP